jgi:hypothetical protein
VPGYIAYKSGDLEAAHKLFLDFKSANPEENTDAVLSPLVQPGTTGELRVNDSLKLDDLFRDTSPTLAGRYPQTVATIGGTLPAIAGAFAGPPGWAWDIGSIAFGTTLGALGYARATRDADLPVTPQTIVAGGESGVSASSNAFVWTLGAKAAISAIPERFNAMLSLASDFLE